MPGPRAVQHLQMPHPRDLQGGQMPRKLPGGEGGGLGAGGIDWCIKQEMLNLIDLSYFLAMIKDMYDFAITTV